MSYFKPGVSNNLFQHSSYLTSLADLATLLPCLVQTKKNALVSVQRYGRRYFSQCQKSCLQNIAVIYGRIITTNRSSSSTTHFGTLSNHDSLDLFGHPGQSIPDTLRRSRHHSHFLVYFMNIITDVAGLPQNQMSVDLSLSCQPFHRYQRSSILKLLLDTFWTG